MQFHEYLGEVVQALNKFESWRVGQTYFNVLYRVRPDLSEAIRGTHLDPFHNDDEVPKFLAWASANWELGEMPTPELLREGGYPDG
jgi:hypothetical protein